MWDIKECNLSLLAQSFVKKKKKKKLREIVTDLKKPDFSFTCLILTVKSHLKKCIFPINNMTVMFLTFICPWTQVAHIKKQMWKRLHYIGCCALKLRLSFFSRLNHLMLNMINNNNIVDHVIKALKGSFYFNTNILSCNLLMSLQEKNALPESRW